VKTKYGVPAVAMAAVLVCAEPGTAASPEKPGALTICELITHQSAHDGELVHLRAQLSTDAIEHTFAADVDEPTRCAVLIQVNATPLTTDRLDHLRSALTTAHHTSTESHYKAVLAEVRGVFHRQDSGTYLPSLTLTDVFAMQIAERPNPVPPIPSPAEPKRSSAPR
jgi:hypothetical protein